MKNKCFKKLPKPARTNFSNLWLELWGQNDPIKGKPEKNKETRFLNKQILRDEIDDKKLIKKQCKTKTNNNLKNQD